MGRTMSDTDQQLTEKFTKALEGAIPWERTFGHAETLEKFIDHCTEHYCMHEDSLVPYMVCRHFVTQPQHYEEHSFRIGVSGDVDQESNNPMNRDALSIYTLATVHLDARAMFRALRICTDVRTPFLRHFPGSCLRTSGESNFGTFKPDTAYVYIAFFTRERKPPQDGI